MSADQVGFLLRTQQEEAADRLNVLRQVREAAIAAAAPLFNELAENGIVVHSFRDPNSSGINMAVVVPVMLKWLPLIDDENAKQEIASVLTLRAYQKLIVPVLLSQFQVLPNEQYAFAKREMANTVSKIAAEEWFDDIANLVKDQQLGPARSPLVGWLGKRKNRRACAIAVVSTLLERRDLPVVAIEAVRSLKAVELRSIVQTYVADGHEAVRVQARRTLSFLDRPAFNSASPSQTNSKI